MNKQQLEIYNLIEDLSKLYKPFIIIRRATLDMYKLELSYTHNAYKTILIATFIKHLDRAFDELLAVTNEKSEITSTHKVFQINKNIAKYLVLKDKLSQTCVYELQEAIKLFS